MPLELLRQEIYVCPNCDQLQTRELMGLPRQSTRYDIRMNLYWRNKMNNEYPPLPDDADENWVQRLFREE